MMSDTVPNDDPQQRILEMVARGKVSAAEGERLLAALDRPPPEPLSWRLLYDPFSRFASSRVWLGAIAVNLLGLAAALGFGARFDGLLDMHLGHGGGMGWHAVLELIVAWPLGALVLWGVAWIFARRGRLIDFIANVGLARLPLVLAALLGWLLFPPPDTMAKLADPAVVQNPQAMLSALPRLLPGVLVTLPLVVWFFALLVFAVRHGSGLRGGKLAGVFILGALVGEVVTKVALYLVG